MRKETLYIGTYTRPILFGTGDIMQGKGKGIHIYEMDSDTGVLTSYAVAEGVENPSFLAVSPDKDHLYAVNELKEFEGCDCGAVSSFTIEKTRRLSLLNQKATGGQDPCHVCMDGAGKHVIVSNYMTGSVAVFDTEANGSLGKRTAFVQHEGSGINKARQAGPHAHSATFSPDGRFLYVIDLGLDRVVAYHITQDGGLEEVPGASFTCEPGFGPRCCEFHPNLPVCYLIGELGSQVAVLTWDKSNGSLSAIQTVSTLPQDFTGHNTCADLHVSRNGRFLLASNRGHDSITSYATDPLTG